MKPVVLTHKQWDVIFDLIKKEYPLSVATISWKRKEKLGFTVRNHAEWIPNKEYSREQARFENDEKDYFLLARPSKGHTENQICLDFYSENKRTMFVLKYSDVINREVK